MAKGKSKPLLLTSQRFLPRFRRQFRNKRHQPSSKFLKCLFFQTATLFLTNFLVPSNAYVVWTAPAYLADPQYEGDAGTYAGFDASGKCLESDGYPITYTVWDCPFGLTPYFTFNNTKMVLTNTLKVTKVSGWIPDCAIICTNSNGNSSTAYVTLNFFSGNNNPPSFDNSFPRYEYVSNGSYGAYILTAWASDPDTDKITNGNLTWYMVSLDTYSQYFSFFNTSSPVLRVIRGIDWPVGTERVVVLGVHDNPNVGYALSASVSVTLCWGCPIYTGSSTSSSTTALTTTALTQNVAFLVPVIVGSILVGVALLAGGIVCCCYYCNKDAVSPWATTHDWAPNSTVPKFANDTW